MEVATISRKPAQGLVSGFGPKSNQKGGMGVLERLNRTFKHDFCFRRNPETFSQLYEVTQAFKHWYNNIRKHTSIGFKTPWSVLNQKAILS